MNYTPNQQNNPNRVPQVHPANAANPSSEQRDVLFPSANLPNNMGSVTQQVQSLSHQNLMNQGAKSATQPNMMPTDPAFFHRISEIVNNISQYQQMTSHQVQMASSTQMHHGNMQQIQKVSTVSSVASGIQPKPAGMGNFGANPSRQYSPPKASHPQLKTTPITSKPPQLPGNNTQKSPQQSLTQTAVVSATPIPLSNPLLSSQKPTAIPQEKNVPSSSPQPSAASTSNLVAQNAQKKLSPVSQPSQKLANVPAPAASLSPQKSVSVVSTQSPQKPISPVIPAVVVPQPNNSVAKSELKTPEVVKPTPPPAAKITPTAALKTNDVQPTAEKASPVKPVEQIKETENKPEANAKVEEKKVKPAIPTTPPKSAELKVATTVSKNALRLATVTPPRQKKPPPTRKSATGVEKQPAIRPTTSVVQPTTPKAQKTAKSSTQSSDSASSKIKRSRVQVQPYQCPTRNLELATKLSTKSANQEKKENEDKLIVFYKNEFLAVRAEEGSFYICQAVQNVYKPSKSTKIRIQWLNERDAKKKTKEGGRVYSTDYLDHTDFECVLTTVELKKIDSKSYELPKEECTRIENILKKAIDVEKGKKPPVVTEDNPDGLDLSLYESEAQLESKKRQSINSESSDDEEDSKPLIKKRKIDDAKKAEANEVSDVKKEISPKTKKVVQNVKSKKVTPVKSEPKASPSKSKEPITDAMKSGPSKTAGSPTKTAAKISPTLAPKNLRRK